jgi:4-hydroxy-2-oxoheptanedioate aldolase
MISKYRNEWENLANVHTQFVFWITSSTSIVCETLATQSGIDVLLVDGQHGAFGVEEALNLVTACSRGSALSAVRISDSKAEAEVCRVLDAGARIIVCPMINNATSCHEFISHCFYPPQGTRSFGPYRHKMNKAYTFTPQSQNQLISPLAMIETREAVLNLDEILNVPHLSGIFIGPNDLALSYGFTPSSSPQGEVLAIIINIAARTRACGLIAGIFCSDIQIAQNMRNIGFNFIVFGTDVGMLLKNTSSQMSQLHKL